MYGLGPEIEGRLGHGTTCDRDNHVDRAAQGVRHAEQVDPPLEAIARLARETQRPLRATDARRLERSEEHTSELQSRLHLVCRLLLEKKKKTYNIKCIRQ